MAKKDISTLREIFLEYGIDIRDKRGFLRNPIDLLEDMYFKLTPQIFDYIQKDIYILSQGYELFKDEREAGTMTSNF
jgi:hypothetical protein